nr:accessory Sec system protein translocase subunit SecY2 [Streptococcus oricebi]
MLVKFLWMVTFILLYIVGSKLSLPFLDLDKKLVLTQLAPSLEFSAALTGGNLRSMSFLSVGLSPYMSALLLWQMFSFSKKLGLKALAAEVAGRRQMYLTLVVALIQALVVALSLPVQKGPNRLLLLLLHTSLLVAGTFFLIWLSDLNSALGLGGSLTILMTSILAYLPQDLLQSMQDLGLGWAWILGLLLLALLYLYLALLMEHGKYRIPVNKLMIHNRFKKYSYLDIKPNPAGGMPVMYAMTLVSIPQYLLFLALIFFPQSSFLRGANLALSMGQPAWLLLYLLTIFLLGLGFAFVNVSGEEIAKQMQESGDYIEGVYPGRATSRYINGITLRLAVFGSCYLLLLTGLPMLLLLKDPAFLRISMIPGIFLIFLGMVLSLQEEIGAIRLNENYRRFF